MKIIKCKTTYAESFGHDAYTCSTEYTFEIKGQQFTYSRGLELSEEECVRPARQDILYKLLDCNCAVKELFETIDGDLIITTGGEDGTPEKEDARELDYYDLEDYNTQMQVEQIILDTYFEEYEEQIEDLFLKIIAIDFNDCDYFVAPEYFYGKNISLLEYIEKTNNGEVLTPLKIKTVDLGRDDISSASEVIGGIDGVEERIQEATEIVSRSIFNEELLLEDDRVFIIKRGK